MFQQTILFFFDHNVSSQLAQVPELNTVKPDAYHWDFFLLGIMTLVCAVCGLPPVNGVIPQAPMHTKACAIADRDADGKKNKTKFRIREQRWTNLLQALLCGVCLFINPVMKTVPRCVQSNRLVAIQHR